MRKSYNRVCCGSLNLSFELRARPYENKAIEASCINHLNGLDKKIEFLRVEFINFFPLSSLACLFYSETSVIFSMF
jgi:hypothetical protein